MKSLMRWGVTISLIGTTVLGPWLIQNKTLALPTEQIVEKLQAVPVFTIADEQGAPLVASQENDVKVTGVFISQADAANFVERLKEQNAELAGQVRIVPVSLGEIYQIAEENETQTNGLNFAYVPRQSEVDIARALLTERGEEYRGGVPLFVAKAGENAGYLTIERNNTQVIPFFFEKRQLEELVEKFKEDKPELAASVTIDVVPLEGIIDTLERSDDENLTKIILVPTEESINFIRNNSQQ